MSETSENINVNDQRYKLSILKKAVIEERAKTEKITAELNKYKEELIIKQEQIDKLKEELMKIKDGSSKKQIKRFFNDLFEEGEEEQQKMIMNNTILQKENEELKEKIKSLENEKSFISTKLIDSLSDYKNMKEMYEVQVEEMEKSYKAKIEKLERDLGINGIELLQQVDRLKVLTELCKSFDYQKVEYEKQIYELKKQISDYSETIEIKVKEIHHLFDEQDHFLNEIEEYKKQISQLKIELLHYRPEVFDDGDNTPIDQIDITYEFKGELIPNSKGEPRKQIIISFGKEQDCLYFKIQDEEGVNYKNSEINDISINNKYDDRIWINVSGKSYVCRFSPNKIDKIIEFYEKIKVKPGFLEKALQNVTFGDYYY